MNDMETYDEKQARLKELFKLVENRKNWKNPINRFVPDGTDMEGLREAIIHFTGSHPTFTRVIRRKGKKDTWGYQVTAAGYYSAIGA